MNKNELWNLYQWVRKRLTEEERKFIEATKPNLLIATETELAINLHAKLVMITRIIEDSTSLEFVNLLENRDAKMEM